MSGWMHDEPDTTRPDVPVSQRGATRGRARWMARLPVGFFVGLSVGLLAVGLDGNDTNVRAEVRKGVEQRTFSSGAARAEPILREIAKTLHQIDGRLQRLERLAEQAVASRDAGSGATARDRDP